MAATTTGTAPAGATGPLSGNAAAAALESLLNPPEEGTQGGEEAQVDEDEGAAAGSEEQGGSDEDESQEEGAEAEGDEDDESEGDDDEGSESDEDEGEEEAPRGRLYTVRVDGKDEKVNESELIAGYSRQSDYTRKTQALANDRKSVEQDQQNARQERAEYAQLLPQLRKALESGMGQEPDWAKLQAEDQANGTTRYPSTWAAWNQAKQHVEAVKAEERKVAEKHNQDLVAARGKALQTERAKLIEALPAWKDPKFAAKRIDAITALMRSVGFSENEIAVHDHRAIKIADKAARYDALMASRPDLRRKMRVAPVVKPGSGAPTRPEKAARVAASKRLTSTGTVKDAAALFEQLL